MDVTGLDSESEYFFTVSAENSFGEGEPSDVVAGTTAEAPKIPSNPSNIALAGSTTSSITVSFDASPAVPEFPINIYNV